MSQSSLVAFSGLNIPTRRRDGLDLLRICKLPVPNFYEIRCTKDIHDLPVMTAPYGYTVRTCRHNGKSEFGLFNVHYISRRLMQEVVVERLRGHRDEFYVVYPSWKTRFSWNIVFDGFTYVLEGGEGSQKKISAGKGNPDFSLKVPLGFRTEGTLLHGVYDHRAQKQSNRLWQYLRKIPLQSFYAEVAIVNQGATIFYELFELPPFSAAQAQGV